MTIIKARIFTIQKILTNEILVPYLVLKAETVYLQFRLLLEMLYLSTIVIRKKRLSNAWPRSEKEYQPAQIRKYLGANLDEHFPSPFRRNPQSPEGSTILEFFDRPVSEQELYDFFNGCHKILHEPNPYKRRWIDREAECGRWISEAEPFLKRLWQLLKNHYRVSELDDGEKAGLICQLGGDETTPVLVANLLSDGKERVLGRQ